jgi:hypothetical protein
VLRRAQVLIALSCLPTLYEVHRITVPRCSSGNVFYLHVASVQHRACAAFTSVSGGRTRRRLSRRLPNRVPLSPPPDARDCVYCVLFSCVGTDRRVIGLDRRSSTDTTRGRPERAGSTSRASFSIDKTDNGRKSCRSRQPADVYRICS